MAYTGHAANYEVAHPKVPFSTPVQGPLVHGSMIFIRGHIQHGCGRFDINLDAANGDVVLHVNPRFNEGCVVRNTWQGSWGKEERDGGLPIQPGQFECILLVQEDHYKIAFNGKHFTEYRHRIPKESVSSLRVKGDNIHLNNITFQGVPQPPRYDAGGFPGPFMKIPQPGPSAPLPDFPFAQSHQPPPYGAPYGPSAGGFPSPGGYAPPPHQPSAGFPEPAPEAAPGPAIYNPGLPFFGNLSGGMQAGHDVHISGIPNHGAQRFTVNFQCGQAGRNIAFHFDVRFNENCIVGNAMQDDSWGKEVRVYNVPFRQGQNFDLRIRCGPNKYKAFVHNQLLMEFPHRIQPIEKAVLLKITGDIRLTCVRL